ncbi:MAG: hypothetical protein QOK21_3125 [Solirubrobacteraceae bacterium]|nr:hypothetical protein [Solirubrobacteraceae bacterium]
MHGAVLIGGGLVALLLALEKGPEWGWSAPAIIGLFVLSASLLAAWARNELHVAEPLVELRLVRRRAVLTANVTGLVLGASMHLRISLMTQFVQVPSGLGETVFVAGLTLVPLSALSFLSSRVPPTVARRTGQRATIPIGAAVIAAGMLFFALTGDALWQAFVTMGVVGLGLGFPFAAMPGLIIGSVPAQETSSAMSFHQVTRYVGFSIGSGLSITLLRAFDRGGAPASSSYTSTFAVGAGLCLIAAGMAWLLPGSTLVARVPGSTRALDERAIEEGELAAAGLERLEP